MASKHKHSSYELSPKDGTDAGIALLERPSNAPAKDGGEVKEKEDVKLIGPLEILRYADGWDKVLMTIGAIFALAHGLTLPAMLVTFSKSIGVFVDSGILKNFLSKIDDFLETTDLSTQDIIKDPLLLSKTVCVNISAVYGGNITCPSVESDGIYDRMTDLGIFFFYIGLAVTVCGYFEVAFWTLSSERQGKRIREACLHNVLHQNIGWFDVHNANELNTRLSEDIVQIQDGIGYRMVAIIRMCSCSIACVVIGFYHGWKLSLVALAVSPIMFITSAVFDKIKAILTAKELTAYAKAGGIADEVFGAIRTVSVFGGQEKEAVRYSKHLGEAKSLGLKKDIAHGISMGMFYWTLCISGAVGHWYSGVLHRNDPEEYNTENVFIVLFSVLMGFFNLGVCVPSIQALAVARGAAYAVFNLIELPESTKSGRGHKTEAMLMDEFTRDLKRVRISHRLKSTIDSSSDDGIKPTDLKGVIELKNIHFSYPARSDVKVLNDISLKVDPGQTVALVGASGCGKSTLVQLLLRFYNPDHGQILLDGRDIKELNIKWLRQTIGLVSQEPVLFATTITENIQYGSEDVTMDEMIKAAKDANAYDFIMQLPEQFETFVGERGAQLSGGQKQRIAIARALVRDPKILLLDEATSSLDTESESIVQEALDKACQGRTTFIVAHRLSTIRNADLIIGCKDGQFVEKGTHDELMDKKGIYYQLNMKQMMSKDGENDDDNNFENVDLNLTSKKERNHDFTAKKLEDENEDLPKAPYLRLLKMNSPEWYFIVLGCIGGIMSGFFGPGFAIVLSALMNVFAKDIESQKDEFRDITLFYVGLGFVNFMGYVLQATMFGLSGQALTLRLRDLTFRAMLKQEIAWYDDPRNTVGALTTRLSTDASQVQGVTGVRIGSFVNNVSCLVLTLILSFGHGWKMTLILLAFIPFLSIGEVIQTKMYAGQAEKNKEALENAGRITVESVGNIRTIASLSKEETFVSLFAEKLKPAYKMAMRNAHISGIAFSFSKSVTNYFYGAAFIFGAYMVEEGEMSIRDVFIVFNSVMSGALGLSFATSICPDLGKCQLSAKRIIHIIDSEPSINHTNSGGKKLTNDYSANIMFKDVNFHYPTRQTVPVLQDMSLSVVNGQTVALVGSSGCGKSTTVSLLERFYDTVTGSVCLDDHDIKTLNIEWLRSQMALVSQEPVLFDQTIAENIAYGNNSRVVSMDEIVAAARTANIHNFITSLPDGYDTNVGAKGTQISGGQKQRIAIARALVRDPRILLLDEATSSLDAESETVVQEALDKARVGRACVVIAHRLSTVQNADKICVISDGRVTEQGTHNELLARKGFYQKLVEKSMRAV